MKRVVHLPGGRHVSLSTYVQAWKRTLSAPPETTFQSAFNWYPETREEILREFRRGLHDRINRRVPNFPGTLRPRLTTPAIKLTYEWQIETYRAAHQLNQPRLIIDWLPPWLKSRYRHRLRENIPT